MTPTRKIFFAADFLGFFPVLTRIDDRVREVHGSYQKKDEDNQRTPLGDGISLWKWNRPSATSRQKRFFHDHRVP